MTPRGLKRLTNAANRLEAWKDFDKVKAHAWDVGLGNLVAAHTPKPGYGWKRIDACTAALRTAISAALAERQTEQGGGERGPTKDIVTTP